MAIWENWILKQENENENKINEKGINIRRYWHSSKI
mgnify:CR=1 FL=1|jgi:hypothetical protein